MKAIKRILGGLLAVVLAGVVILAIAHFVPLPIAADRDFITLYHTNWTFVRGVDLYDYPTQLELLQSELQINFPFHPFPYPPWFTLATFYLGYFPIEIAARIWFQLNLLMLTASVWLLTAGWKPLTRVLTLIAALLFIPTLGHMVVGQSSTPVLLGMALFLWAARRQSAPGIAVAFGLLTFKPNLGIFLLLAFSAWLISQRRQPYARRALLLIAGMAVFLFSAGFIADPAWPLTYLKGLGGWHEYPVAETCNLCASLTANLIQAFRIEYSDRVGASGGGLLAGLLGIPLIWRFRRKPANPELLAVLITCLTLLAFPYLLNYDYMLLIIPLLVLAGRLGFGPSGTVQNPVSQPNRLGRILLAGAYLLPWGMILWGRDGDLLLIAAALLLLSLAWLLDWQTTLPPTTP